MENAPNYYRLLHVHPDAPEPVIKASYRAMMQKMRLHPDLGGDEGLAQQLNEAVAVLCDPERRAAYDRLSVVSPSTDENTDENTDATEPGGTPSTRAHEPVRRANLTLPVKPHCPFCLGTYPPRLRANRLSSSDAYDTSLRCSHCHGAATPISQLSQSSDDDLRRIYRHDHKTPVLLWCRWPTDAPAHARMTDLSIVGCALEYTAEIAVNTVVLLDSPLLNGIGIIRYSHLDADKGIYSAGLEFLTLQITAEPGSVFSATA